MKFNDFFEIEKYIQVAYLEYRERQQAYFQTQFIIIFLLGQKLISTLTKTVTFPSFEKSKNEKYSESQIVNIFSQ